MKLLLEKWKKFLNESVVTVDFDNTLKMKDTKISNEPVINKIKELGSKVYIVSRRKPSEVFDKDKETRKDYESAEAEIKSFIKKYKLTDLIDGIYLTSWQNKGKILDELGSDMHIDDSDKTWRELEQDYPNIKLIKVDHETGEIIEDIEETIEKSGDEYCLKSKKNKNLGCSSSRTGAEKREKQVNYFKHKDK